MPSTPARRRCRLRTICGSKLPSAVPGHLDLDRADLGQHRLRAACRCASCRCPARPGHACRSRGGRDLALQRGLQHPLGQLLQQPTLAGQTPAPRRGPGRPARAINCSSTASRPPVETAASQSSSRSRSTAGSPFTSLIGCTLLDRSYTVVLTDPPGQPTLNRGETESARWSGRPSILRIGTLGERPSAPVTRLPAERDQRCGRRTARTLPAARRAGAIQVRASCSMTENLVSGSGRSQRSAATRAAAETAAASTSGPSRPASASVRAAIASARGRSIAAMVSRNSVCSAGAEVIRASASRSGSPSSEYCSMSAPTTACSSGSSSGTRAQRSGDGAAAFRRERDHDRLLAAGEVVVVGTWGHPGGLGDVVDANVLRSVFEGQAQRGGAEGVPGGELLALAHAAAVVGAPSPQPTENCAHA